MKLKLIKGTNIEDGMCDCLGCFYLNVDDDICEAPGGVYVQCALGYNRDKIWVEDDGEIDEDEEI